MKRTKRFAWTLRNWKKRENTYKQFFKIMVIQRMYLKGDYRERQVHTTPERTERMREKIEEEYHSAYYLTSEDCKRDWQKFAHRKE